MLAGSEESGVSENIALPLPMLALRCAGCGYGTRRRTEPERCPMCGGTAWTREGWQLFADLARSVAIATQRHTTAVDDALAPLTPDPLIADPDLTPVFQAVPLS
jgi:hypothetical protein